MSAARFAPLLCRPVLPADKDQAFVFLRRIWDGEDYLPEVWDDWLADPRGLFVAAELEGRVVGLGRLTDLGEGEAWLEGLRVHPDLEGRGIATHIHHYLLERWRASPATVVRLATASTRSAVHRLCQRTGFIRVANLIDVAAPAVSGRHDFTRLAPERVVEPFMGWEGTEVGRAVSGLMELDWTWARQTPQRLRVLASRETAWSWGEGQGAIVATSQNSDDEHCLRLHSIAVDVAGLSSLLEDARRLAWEIGLAEVRWRAPADEMWMPLLLGAGFEPRWSMTLFVYEKTKETDRDGNQGRRET